MGNKNEGYLGGIMGGESRVGSGGGLKRTGILSLEEAGTQTVDVVSVPDVSDLSLTDGLTLVSGTEVDLTAASNSYEDAYITLPTGSGYVYAEVHMYAVDESNIHQAVGLIDPTYIDTGANGQTNDKAYTVKRVGTSWFRMTGSHNTVTQTIMGRAATNTYHFLANLDTGDVWLGITPEGSTLRWIRNDNTMNATWSASDPTFSALDLTTYNTFYFQQYYTTQSAWVNFGGNPLFDGQLSSGNDSSDWFKDPDASLSASSFTLGTAETRTLPQLSWGGITGRSVLTEGSAAVPGDDNWNDVSLLIRGDTQTDLSGNAHTLTFTGATANDQDPVKFATGSLYFDGSEDYITVPDAAAKGMGSSDFTVEGWFRTASTARQFLLGDLASSGSGTSCSMFMQIHTAGDLRFLVSDGTTDVSLVGPTSAISTNTWHHIAAVRSGSTLSLYLDGVLQDSGAITLSLQDNAEPYRIGRSGSYTANSGFNYSGNIEDLRITKGVARYTAAFTPPTESFPTSLPATSQTLVNTGIFTLEEIYELTKSA